MKKDTLSKKKAAVATAPKKSRPVKKVTTKKPVIRIAKKNVPESQYSVVNIDKNHPKYLIGLEYFELNNQGAFTLEYLDADMEDRYALEHKETGDRFYIKPILLNKETKSKSTRLSELSEHPIDYFYKQLIGMAAEIEDMLQRIEIYADLEQKYKEDSKKLSRKEQLKHISDLGYCVMDYGQHIHIMAQEYLAKEKQAKKQKKP